MFDIVLITRSPSPAVMASSTVGPSSPIFATSRGENPAECSARAVPSVATNVQPICTRRETIGKISGLSTSAIVSSTAPPGRMWRPEAAKALRIAAARVRSIPIASPVDFIAGTLDVLHDSRDDDRVAVRDRVDLHLVALEVLVHQHGAARHRPDRPHHVSLQLAPVVHDLHRASAEYV